MKNNLSTNYITRSKQTTRSADVFSVGERLSHCGSADACLTRTARVYLYQIAPSVFGFVRNLSEKGSPCSIVNRLGEHAASQAFDIQVFDNNRSEILNQPERQTMLELVPLIPDSSVNFLEQCNRFAPTLRAFLAARNLSLRSTKTRLSLLIETRIRNGRIVSECREVFEANINSDCVVERRQRFGFAFDREADVPLAALALHRDGLNLARNGAVQFHFDYSALPGITRHSIMTICKDLGISVVEQIIPREMLYIANEVFFCGTAVEVTPIRSIDRVKIGIGSRGPITKRIQDEFFALAEGKKPDRHNWLTPVGVPAAAVR